jgi:hypothetical protein
MPYIERFCRCCDLGKVENEEHLHLVCPNTQKISEHVCLALPLTHTNIIVNLMKIINTVALANILANFMKITNTVALAKFVACYQYHSTIYPP